VICSQTKEIICTTVDKGRKHDFRVFKESEVSLCTADQIQADSGYQGIQKLYPAASQLPFKHTKTKGLTKAQKKHNRHLAADRVVIEHVIRELKIFKILAYPYRNRRKRFLLRLNLIAGLYNYELNI
jgi:DDE superfamily endonuclease